MGDRACTQSRRPTVRCRRNNAHGESDDSGRQSAGDRGCDTARLLGRDRARCVPPARRRGRPGAGAAGRPGGPALRAGDRGPGAARGRPFRYRRLPHRRRHSARRGVAGRASGGDPLRTRSVRAAPARLRGPHGRSTRSATRPCSSTTCRIGWPWACPATTSRSTPMSSSSTAPAAPTSTSAASPASPPRPPMRRSCCAACSGRGALGPDALNTKAVIYNVKGEDLLFIDRPNRNLSDEERARYGTLGLGADPFSSVELWAPPRRGSAGAVPGRGDPARRRPVVLLDRPSVLCGRPPAVPLRRRRRRPPAVHHRHPERDGAAPSGGTVRRRGRENRGRRSPDLSRPRGADRSARQRRRHGADLGRARDRPGDDLRIPCDGCSAPSVTSNR